MGIVLSLLLAAGASGGAAPTVEPAGTVAARLGDVLGRPVETARALARVPVLIDPQGMRPDATLRALAFALHASLVPDGRTLRMERTASDRKAMRAAHVEANRARIEAGLATWDRILERADALGDAAAGVRRAREDVARVLREGRTAQEAGRPLDPPPPDLMGEYMVTPVGRLLHGLLTRLGPARLADLGPDETRILGDHPEGEESPLPPCEDLIAAYAKSQAAYAVAMDLPEPEEPPARPVLSLSEGGASVALYDARGRSIGKGGVSYEMRPVLVGVAEPASPESAWVDLDARSRLFEAVTHAKRGEFRPATLPDAYLHPERFDPLDFAVRTGLLALPREPGAKPLVAALSDDLLDWAEPFVREGRLDAPAFARRLLRREGGDERVVHDGATVVRTPDADATEPRIADREVLGREIRRIVAARNIDLRNWSLLHLALYPATSVTRRCLQPLPNLGFRAFPFLDSLSNGEYALLGAALRSNASVVDARTPPFDRLVRDGIAQGWLRFSDESGTSVPNLDPSTLLARLRGATVALADTETPVAMRYGILNPADPSVHRRLSGDYLRGDFHQAEDAESLGASAALSFTLRLHPSPADRAKAGLDADHEIRDFQYFLGRRLALAVDVRLPGGLHAHVEARDWIPDRDGLAFTELPESFQEGMLRGAGHAIDRPPVLSHSQPISP